MKLVVILIELMVMQNNFWAKWGHERGRVNSASQHRISENQLKQVIGQKIFRLRRAKPAALRAALFTKKHIHSLHLSGARPHEILAVAEYQSEEQADAGAGMGARG